MKLRFSHLKIGRLIQKERIVSQPAFFRGKLAVSFRECSLSPFLLGGGRKSPRRFKPPPKVLGWFHVAAGYHIIGDYAVGHWVLRWFHGQFCFFDSKHDESGGKTTV